MTIFNDWRIRLQVKQKRRERRQKIINTMLLLAIAFFLGMAWQYYLTIK